MNYYIFQDNKNIGPLSEGEVIGGLRNGRFQLSDLGCRAGESSWKDLRVLFPNEDRSNSVPRPPRQVNQPQFGSQSASHSGQVSDVGKLMIFESQKKSAGVAILLCLFLGGLGIHRFYLGKTESAVAILAIWLVSWPLMFIFIGFLTILIPLLWAFVDLFLVSGIARQYNEKLALRLGIYS